MEGTSELHIPQESELPGLKRAWICWYLLYYIFQIFLTVIHKKYTLHQNPAHTSTHTREKRISTITTYEVYVFSPFYLVRLHFLKCCVYMTKLISWQLMGHGLQFGIYCIRLYLTFFDTVKSLSEKNGAI